MKQLVATIALSATLAGCATTSGYNAVLQTWVGDSSDHLVSVWGVPENVYNQSSGGKVLQYSRSNQIVLPGMTTYQAQTTYSNGMVSTVSSNGNPVYGTYGGTSTTYVPHTSDPTMIATHCETRFTSDASGRITNWSWQGNSCKARAPKKAATPTVVAVPEYQKCTADQLRHGGC
jgi:hypothetical protein